MFHVSLEVVSTGRRSLGRQMRSVSNRHRISEEQAVMNEIRRSKRQRKLTYDTFNQNLIDKQMPYLSTRDMNRYQTESIEMPRKKRRREVEPDPESEVRQCLQFYPQDMVYPQYHNHTHTM